jgi:hypothetical protein
MLYSGFIFWNQQRSNVMSVPWREGPSAAKANGGGKVRCGRREDTESLQNLFEAQS